MFDVGFSELIVIAIVALVVIGPERLPKVARTAGLLLGRLQRYVNDVKADINREMQLDELKSLRSELQESAHDFERQVSNEISSVEQLARQTAGAVAEAAATPATATVEAPVSHPIDTSEASSPVIAQQASPSAGVAAVSAAEAAKTTEAPVAKV